MDIVSVTHLLVILLLVALVVILLARRIELPYTLGLVVVGLLMSLIGPFEKIQLNPDLVLFVFLPALLFEGSWSASVNALRENWRTIFLLAVPGLILEVVLIALPLIWFTQIPWQEAFLLAAILSPTDPVAVLGLFRQMKVSEKLAAIIEGESLFNDGVAGALYQVFLTFLLLMVRHQPVTVGEEVWIGIETVVVEMGGGIVVGAVCGLLISRFVKHVDEHLIETTITIITTYGVYLLADFLHTSGILAVIVAGLIIGSYGSRYGMSERTREAIDGFWGVVAFVVNALLFLLVGAQLDPRTVFLFKEPAPLLVTAGVTIVVVLLARWVMVILLPRRGGMMTRTWRLVIFLSGLRGALSLALVLALPLEIPNRSALLISTYAVVLFTLLGQGLALRFILPKLSAV